jgi:type IV secretion system protein VirB1
MLATLVLAQLLRQCASNVDPVTMSAVVRVESAGDDRALHDNTAQRSYAPKSLAEAASWASQLIALGHSVDIGLSQINSANLPKLGLSVAVAYDPCTNLHAGATILGADYASAAQLFGPGQTALRRALCAYNTGSFFAGRGYLSAILLAAGLSPEYGDGPGWPPSLVAHSSIVVYGTNPALPERPSRAPAAFILVTPWVGVKKENMSP